MRRALAFALGLGLGANSLWMLITPETWYHAMPGVPDTGPMNLHFIRDIGCAYFVVALSLLWLARSPMRARPVALAGGAFLALHAMVHVWDFTAGREHAHGFLNDLPSVFLPAILTLWLAWPRGTRRKWMIDPKVKRHGDVALLTFNLVNYGKLPDAPERVLARWNSTEVYSRIGRTWKIIHSHWSYIQPELKQTGF